MLLRELNERGQTSPGALADSLELTRGAVSKIADKLDTLRGTDNAFGPTWSPDSRELLFMSNGALKRINTVDHSVRVIANTDIPTGPGVFSAVWLPDGTIVFAGRDALYRLPVNGGSPTRHS